MAKLYLEEQRIFDSLQFDQDNWQLPEWRDQKTRHIQLHVAKATLKLVSSHNSDLIVAADSALYRSQLINIHNLDPDEATAPIRIVKGLETIDDEKVPVTDIPTPRTSLIYAAGHLAQYLEPREHGRTEDGLRATNVMIAARHLHSASTHLGRLYDKDPSQLHLQRMRAILGERVTKLTGSTLSLHE